MKRVVAVLGVLFALCSLSLGQQAASKAKLGTNLSGPADWATELPFVDVFRLSRQWISQREGAGWGKGPELKLDEHGWVKELESGCFAETPVCTIQGSHYPAGRYTVLYEGEGKLDFNNAKVAEASAGKILIDVPGNGSVFVRVRQTNPQNYVRNIRMIMPGFEKTYEKEPFHPVFLKRWQGMAAFRFMDWMETNGSKVSKWEDRPKMDDATWTARGIPLEVMIDFSNRTKADPWFCMPHLATDEYVRSFAKQVKEKLDPSLKPHIEYSNEVWNGMFESNRYAQKKAKELNLGEPARPWEGGCYYYGQRSVEIFKIWEEVYGGKDRLVRVVAWQAAAGPYWLDGMLMSKLPAGSVDALAIAPYMTFLPRPNGKDQASDSDEVAKWSVEQVLDHTEQKCLPESSKWMQAAAAVAKKYNVKLMCYEAGQHLVGVGGGENNDQLTKLFMQANANPRMGEIYSKYYKAWEAAGGDLLCNFSSVSGWSKWGSWGLVQFYDEGPADSGKLKTTLEWGKSLGQNIDVNYPTKQDITEAAK